MLILHSDGLRTTWEWSDVRHGSLDSTDQIAHRLLSTLGKYEDDATVLVAKHSQT
jgi:hypothetical protein